MGRRHTLAVLEQPDQGNVHLRGNFSTTLQRHGMWPLRARNLRTLQVNVGKLCNQRCNHCHVDAGPDRREVMTRQTFEACLDMLRHESFQIVDITGGAPELNPNFRWFIEACKQLNLHVIDRCNLTVLLTGSSKDLPTFLASHQVEIIASLPHYLSHHTERQRGIGVFDRSIAALKRLNEVGYASSPELVLNLVTNPAGAFLPPNQNELELHWKHQLRQRYGIEFTSLFTMTNVPIRRFLQWLKTSENIESYHNKLRQSFNAKAVYNVMCRDLVSVSWDGKLYDCDFNQMEDLPMHTPTPQTVYNYDLDMLKNRNIRVAEHCFACTAGSGSSCGGATAVEA